MFRAFVKTLLLLVVIACAQAAVLTLTPDSFASATSAGKQVFVAFTAPWCGFCQKLAPIWEDAANSGSSVEFAKVDCEDYKDFCRSQNVNSYPALRFFDNGVGTAYNGGRDLASLLKFAKNPAVQPAPPPIVAAPIDDLVPASVAKRLNKDNFGVTNAGVWLVMFHIGSKFDRESMPAFVEAAKNTAGSGVHAGIVDALQDRELAERFDMRGFPQFIAISNGNAKVFSGNKRTAETLAAFAQTAAREQQQAVLNSGAGIQQQSVQTAALATGPTSAHVQNSHLLSSNAHSGISVGMFLDAHPYLFLLALTLPVTAFVSGVLLGWTLRGSAIKTKHS